MRAVYASRWFRLAALLWVIGFFVVFIPAHRRGVVTLPGNEYTTANAATQQVSAACPLCTTMKSEGQPLPADAPVNCSVCHLKAGLDLPTAIVLAPSFVEELDFLLGDSVASDAPLFASQITLHGRAPPAAV